MSGLLAVPHPQAAPNTFVAQPQAAAAAGPTQHGFSPYVNNGGSVVAVAGKDFAVVGADTRLSLGYSILSRTVSKTVKLTDRCVLATAGMQADQITLHKILLARMKQYEYKHGRQMNIQSIAQMLANTLYYKRFFPYYTFNVLAGVDDKGEGAVYSYDAIGSFERVPFSSSGSGQALIQPVLDNQVEFKNRANAPADKSRSLDDTVLLVKDVMASAGERDIYTGDEVEVIVIRDGTVKTEMLQLRRD